MIPYYILHHKEYKKKAQWKIEAIRNVENLSERKTRFDSFFREHFKLTDKLYKSVEELCQCPPVEDIYIVGSDQTWNPNVGRNPDAFYLTFAPEGALRASYAPSVSVAKLTAEQAVRMKMLLADIQFLSCREESGSALLRKLTEREVTTVLDPTFLLSAEEWNRYAKPTEHPKRYILQYYLGDIPEHREYCKRLGAMMGLVIVSLPMSEMDYGDSECVKKWVGPGEFLTLIRDAELICTDSFHATAFSINYERPVYSFLKHSDDNKLSGNSRLSDIYNLFDIHNRIITEFDKLPTYSDIPIDYSRIRKRRNTLLTASHRYLDGIFSYKGD